MVSDIIVMYGIRGEAYRTVIDNLLVLLIGGIPIAMPTVLSVTMAIGSHRLPQQVCAPLNLWILSVLASYHCYCLNKLNLNSPSDCWYFSIQHNCPTSVVQGAITKRMTAIEEMAGMDVLCSDKTGTLTLNQLTVDKSMIEVYFLCIKNMYCIYLHNLVQNMKTLLCLIKDNISKI